MTSIPVPPLPRPGASSPPPARLSQVGRAAHDLGLAGLLGGNLFGRLALHPSLTEISDQEERGKVVNAAWRRYGTVNSLSLLVGVVALTGVATAVEGVRFARSAPGGAVPMRDGGSPRSVRSPSRRPSSRAAAT